MHIEDTKSTLEKFDKSTKKAPKKMHTDNLHKKYADRK